jgi:hypothetical protein
VESAEGICGYHNKTNKTFKLWEVCKLVTTKLEEVTAEKWQDAIHHVIQEKQRMWELDGLTLNIVDLTCYKRQR